MRALLSMLTGFCLIALWSVALVAHEDGWLAWVDAAAGAVAVVSAFGFVRGRHRARVLMAMNGAVLLVGSLLAASFGTARWVRWTSIALAAFALLIGLSRRANSSKTV